MDGMLGHTLPPAGLPAAIVERAREILGTLEGEHRMVPGAPPPLERDAGQLVLFADPPADPVMDDLKALDLDELTPLEALNRLADLQRRAQRPGSRRAGDSDRRGDR